jgi:hypothetical protein
VCGAVRFSVVGAPALTGLCHCADCRKFSGSAFLHYGDWPSSSFSVAGDYRVFDGRAFCPVCGSRLFHPGDEWVEIELGALDAAPSDLVPQQEGWIIRREHWLAPVPGARQAERDPPKD